MGLDYFRMLVKKRQSIMDDIDDMGPAESQPLGDSMAYSQILERQAPTEVTTRHMQPSNGSSFGPSQEIRIPLSVQHGVFVASDSVCLNFTCQLDRTATAADASIGLDGGAGAVVREIAVYGPTGNVINRVSEYNKLNWVMDSYTRPAVDQIAMDGFSFVAAGAGLIPAAGDRTDSGSDTGTRQFTLRLSRVGLFNCDRLIPLGFTAGAPVSVSIILESTAQAITASSASTSVSYSLSDVSISMDCITYSSAVTSQFESLVQQIGGVQWASKPDSHFKMAGQTALGTSSNISVQIPVREKSTNYLVTTLHPNSTQNVQASRSITGLINRGLTEYSHSIGGLQFPPKPVKLSATHMGEHIRQYQRVLGKLNDPQFHNILTYAQIGDDAGGTASRTLYSTDKDKGSLFAIWQSFQPERNKLENGLALNDSSLNVILQATGATMTESTICTTFVNSDAIYTLTASGELLVSS